MSRITSGFLGVTVAALAMGAATIQIAAGRDLGALTPDDASLKMGNTVVYDVNNATKSDRVTLAQADVSGPTIVFQNPHLPFTTIAALVRQELAAAEDQSRAKHTAKTRKSPAKQKIATACERNVSVLSEVAKLLDAGRCIT